MEKKMKVNKNAKMTAAEMEEFESDLTALFEDGIRDGSAIVSDGPWADTVKAIKERRRREETKMASFRLPVWVIEGLKRNAAKGGVKYSEYAIETLAKDAV